MRGYMVLVCPLNSYFFHNLSYISKLFQWTDNVCVCGCYFVEIKLWFGLNDKKIPPFDNSERWDQYYLCAVGNFTAA